MKDRECIKCENFFDCVGKDNKNPCLHFKPRKEIKSDSIYNRTSTKDKKE